MKAYQYSGLMTAIYIAPHIPKWAGILFTLIFAVMTFVTIYKDK